MAKSSGMKNAPSKTGRPSGGGRTNNPSKIGSGRSGGSKKGSK